MFEKLKFLLPDIIHPNLRLDKIHPDLRPIVLGAKERGLVVSYNPFTDTVTLQSKVWRPLAGMSETYDAKTGKLICSIRS